MHPFYLLVPRWEEAVARAGVAMGEGTAELAGDDDVVGEIAESAEG